MVMSCLLIQDFITHNHKPIKALLKFKFYSAISMEFYSISYFFISIKVPRGSTFCFQKSFMITLAQENVSYYDI